MSKYDCGIFNIGYATYPNYRHDNPTEKARHEKEENERKEKRRKVIKEYLSHYGDLQDAEAVRFHGSFGFGEDRAWGYRETTWGLLCKELLRDEAPYQMSTKMSLTKGYAFGTDYTYWRQWFDAHPGVINPKVHGSLLTTDYPPDAFWLIEIVSASKKCFVAHAKQEEKIEELHKRGIPAMILKMCSDRQKLRAKLLDWIRIIDEASTK